MLKTSVYLSEEDADSLRRAAEATGITQSDLIREGIRQVVAAHCGRRRTFHSMGQGINQAAGPARHWTATEVYEKTRGRR
ncbi:MAG: ribbon-helix-helix domain-containing protein [Candidatus Dormibacteraeota bacterium]|uniref:Ribbon-helix-helix domain-containing protein n=1 Tax=Candidatus Dormiibacter inghamiae TaxID=3127013 RepID=A0A934KF88_9BACT|nr:ribbon-helix-helix domain-containing protein [Candidatus Dormibacteraeota bacterium]MBJ7606905.1 ribbon-helix-helix domain-containing protein [Candidatus Dormibacteraeota bacterium]